MDDDRIRWDERYRLVADESGTAAADVVPRRPEILAWFPDLVRRLPTSGRALDLACGTGAVTLWLAARSLRVAALDVSPVAIDILEAAARDAGLEPLVDARVTDLDTGIPDDLVDLDLIVCQRFRDPALYPALPEHLRPGGLALVTVLSTVGADAPGPYHAPAGELLGAFTGDGCTVIAHDERDGVASIALHRP